MFLERAAKKSVKARAVPLGTSLPSGEAPKFLLVALAYFTVAYFGLQVASINPSATPVWPATGLAIVVMLLWGHRIAPAIFVAAFIVNYLTAGSPLTSAVRLTLSTLPTALIEELHDTLAIKPVDDSQRTAQTEMVKALHTAMDARRQRIIVSQSAVGTVKWAGILLMGLCTLVAIAMVHSDNRLACAISLTLFATGIALSLLLIAAYSRPFTGEISVRPDLLKQVITKTTAPPP